MKQRDLILLAIALYLVTRGKKQPTPGGDPGFEAARR